MSTCYAEGNECAAPGPGNAESCWSVEHNQPLSARACVCKCHARVLIGAQPDEQPEAVNHPAHYGGADNLYEAIKVIEAWGLGFCLGNTVKYIARADHKGSRLEDLKKAAWYLAREIENEESKA